MKTLGKIYFETRHPHLNEKMQPIYIHERTLKNHHVENLPNFLYSIMPLSLINSG